MKTKFFSAACLTLIFFAGGCAVTSPSFAPEQSIPVEIRPTSPVTVSKADAVRQDGRVLVSGSLKRPHRVHLSGHVDVLFLGADGSPVAEKEIKVPSLYSKRRGVQEIPFVAEFELDLPAGARAVFSYQAP